jgi:hypothetical protein
MLDLSSALISKLISVVIITFTLFPYSFIDTDPDNSQSICKRNYFIESSSPVCERTSVEAGEGLANGYTLNIQQI